MSNKDFEKHTTNEFYLEYMYLTMYMRKTNFTGDVFEKDYKLTLELYSGGYMCHSNF